MILLSKDEKEELLEVYPLHSQERPDMGNAIAIYHFFLEEMDWYVLEAGKEGQTPTGEDKIKLFGLVCMNEVELGYFSLNELEEKRFSMTFQDISEDGFQEPFFMIERDKNFEPTLLKDLKGDKVQEYLTLMGWNG